MWEAIRQSSFRQGGLPFGGGARDGAKGPTTIPLRRGGRWIQGAGDCTWCWHAWASLPCRDGRLVRLFLPPVFGEPAGEPGVGAVNRYRSGSKCAFGCMDWAWLRDLTAPYRFRGHGCGRGPIDKGRATDLGEPFPPSRVAGPFGGMCFSCGWGGGPNPLHRWTMDC